MGTKNRATPGDHAVACGHRVVAEAAEEVLLGGGNAFDACVAGGLAACVAADYADFLEALAGGRVEDLYHGAFADRIAADMQQGDGLITRDDLSRFRTVERAPLAWTYRGLRVLTNPTPSFGGALLALSLSLLEAEDLTGCTPGGECHALAIAEVLREVDRLRAQGVYEPFGLATGDSDADDDPTGRPVFSRGTTHLSVSDGRGNVASMTTSNGEGSGYIVPGTGIMLNNMLGEDDLHPHGFHADPPGTRVASMMAPTLVADDGGVALVLGSGGSKRIRTALLQVLCRRFDLGQPLASAVLAPRLHWTQDRLDVEPGFSAAATRALQARYPSTNLWSDRNLFFGGVHAVDPREPAAAADVRREGHALLGACP